MVTMAVALLVVGCFDGVVAGILLHRMDRVIQTTGLAINPGLYPGEPTMSHPTSLTGLVIYTQILPVSSPGLASYQHVLL